jgi:hypothetical protein
MGSDKKRFVILNAVKELSAVHLRPVLLKIDPPNITHYMLKNVVILNVVKDLFAVHLRPV